MMRNTMEWGPSLTWHQITSNLFCILKIFSGEVPKEVPTDAFTSLMQDSSHGMCNNSLIFQTHLHVQCADHIKI